MRPNNEHKAIKKQEKKREEWRGEKRRRADKTDEERSE